jgi:asparaginyl-tRNA synthetase
MGKHAIADLLDGSVGLGAEVAVQGWVRTRRDSKAGLSFLQVSDGTCFASLQVVADGALPNYVQEVQHLGSGCAVTVRGELVESQGRGQSVEIRATEIAVQGWVDDPDTYPISPKRHSFEFLREVAHLRPRTNTFGAVARVRNCLAQAVHRFFDAKGYLWVHTPIITASDTEGAGELFRVSTLDVARLPRTADGTPDFSRDFFGREAFLTVSGQLNVEAYCLALSNVYTFGPTFRAENSNTSRHLAEFWMIEPETAFADLGANADLAEALLKHLFRTVLEERDDDMEFFAQRLHADAIERLRGVVDQPFERMTYTEAVRALQNAKRRFEFEVSWGADLHSEHERYLTEDYVRRPLVVTNYPKGIKPFYMRLDDGGETVAAMDVLAPGIGEIVGGSQREERLEVLDSRLADCGIDPQPYGWYRDLRRYGTVPHAGFGLGLERTISYVTGMANVRDVIPFPRTPGSAEF